MAFNKPSIVDITSFDATEEKKIYFNVGRGDLHTKVLATVTEKDKPAIIYKQLTLPADSNFFVLPANSLENSRQYVMVLQIGDGEKWSEKSASDYFSCYQKAQIQINDILPDGTTVITNRVYTFTGKYTQASDPIRYYRFKVFKDDGTLFYDTGNIYDTFLSAQVTGFENEEYYSVKLEVLSQSGIANETQTIPFRVRYAKSGLESQMDVVCDNYSGDVTVRAVVRDQQGVYYDYTDGKLTETTELPIYVKHKDNTGQETNWISLPSNKAAVFETDDKFADGFTLQIWFTRSNLTDFIDLGKIMCGDNVILVRIGANVIEANCHFHGKDCVYGLPIVSPTTPCNETMKIMIKNGMLEFQYEKGGVL